MTAPLFNADALGQLRDLNRAALTSLAFIERMTVAAGGQGGANTGARSWAALADGAAIPCRLSPITPGSPSAAADQTVDLARWLVAFDLTAPDIRPGDRLTITGVDIEAQDWERVVTVVGVQTPRTYSAMRLYVCEDAPPGRR